MRRVLLIVNPISGRGRGKAIAPKLAEILGQIGLLPEIFYTEKEGDARRRAEKIEDSTELIIGVGGDGTLNEILNGLPRKIPLALFPSGTSNVLATELSLPRVASAFGDLIQNGKIAEIDTMRANGRLGFFALGVGFDGMVIQQLEKRRRGGISKWTYLPIILHCLRNYQTPELRVTVDGQCFEGISFALIANTKNFGGVFSLSPKRQLDDGLYECYLFQGRGRLALAKYLTRGILNRLLNKKDPIFCQARKIKVESMEPDRQIPYEIDGEFGGTTPVEIEIIPKGMQILTQ